MIYTESNVVRFLALLFLPVLTFFSSCKEEEPAPVQVESVALTPSSLTLKVGETSELTATVYPSDAADCRVEWTSRKPYIADVDDNGKVTAYSEGITVVSATTIDGGYSDVCMVKVLADEIPVETVIISKESLVMTEGDELTLTATVNPSNATNKNVIWSSSNPSVASVSNGKVTALSAGTTTITVTTEDGGKTATCEVTVSAKVYPVTGVTLDRTVCELTEGYELALIETVIPSNATNKNVIWSSSNPSVASVSDGKVTALSAGTTTITVTTEDGGKTATCEVTVSAKVYPVTGVTLNKTVCNLTEGDELTLTATVNPSNATNKNVIWSSSNPSVASVSDGKVTALSAGTTTITVTTEDGGKTATCEVTVSALYIPVTGVNLSKSPGIFSLNELDELTLIATVTPENATNKNVIWSSSDESLATVNDGVVKARKGGVVTITVTTEDGGKTATRKLTIVPRYYSVQSVSLDKTSLEMTEGDEATLTATVAPSFATIKSVHWSSSNTSVVTVSDGKVTAVNPGTATITVTATDNGKTATCEVTVLSRYSGGNNENVGKNEGVWN